MSEVAYYISLQWSFLRQQEPPGEPNTQVSCQRGPGLGSRSQHVGCHTRLGLVEGDAPPSSLTQTH